MECMSVQNGPELTAPQGLRPAQRGVLLLGRVTLGHAAATVTDPAERGVLRAAEAGDGADCGWQFQPQTPRPRAAPLPFEEAFINGYCGLITGRSTLEEPEIAYELLRSAHGNGYATEAASAVLAAAIATGRRRLWATVRTWNTPSFRVLAKLGFERRHSTWDDGGELVWNVREL